VTTFNDTNYDHMLSLHIIRSLFSLFPMVLVKNPLKIVNIMCKQSVFKLAGISKA